MPKKKRRNNSNGERIYDSNKKLQYSKFNKTDKETNRGSVSRSRRFRNNQTEKEAEQLELKQRAPATKSIVTGGSKSSKNERERKYDRGKLKDDSSCSIKETNIVTNHITNGPEKGCVFVDANDKFDEPHLTAKQVHDTEKCNIFDENTSIDSYEELDNFLDYRSKNLISDKYIEDKINRLLIKDSDSLIFESDCVDGEHINICQEEVGQFNEDSSIECTSKTDYVTSPNVYQGSDCVCNGLIKRGLFDPWPSGLLLDLILLKASLYRKFSESHVTRSHSTRESECESDSDSISEIGSLLESLASQSSGELDHKDINSKISDINNNNNNSNHYHYNRHTYETYPSDLNREKEEADVDSSNTSLVKSVALSELSDTLSLCSEGPPKYSPPIWESPIEYHQDSDSSSSDYNLNISKEVEESSNKRSLIDILSKAKKSHAFEHEEDITRFRPDPCHYEQRRAGILGRQRNAIFCNEHFPQSYIEFQAHNCKESPTLSYDGCVSNDGYSHYNNHKNIDINTSKGTNYHSSTNIRCFSCELEPHKISSSSLSSSSSFSYDYKHSDLDPCEKLDLNYISHEKTSEYEIEGNEPKTRGSIASLVSLNDSKDYEASLNGSMKTFRNVAKLSIPSFSSLQYLPGQIDSFYSINKYLSDKDRGNIMEQNQADDYSSTTAHRGAEVEVSQYNQTKPKQQDELKLFQRLCLCNCVSKKINKNNNTDEASRDELSCERDPLKPLVVDVSGRRDFAGSCSSVHDAVAAMNIISQNEDSGESIVSQNRVGIVSDSAHRDNTRQEKKAKHSPNFLSLLRLTSPSSLESMRMDNENDKHDVDPSDDAGHSSNGNFCCKVKVNRDEKCSNSRESSLSSCLGSKRDSESLNEYGDDNDNNVSGNSHDLEQMRPASSASAVRGSELGESEKKQQPYGRPQSACSIHEPSEKKNINLKRFIPNAFSKNHQQQEQQQHKNQSSFISRSLTRLSSRRHKSSKVKSNEYQEVNADRNSRKHQSQICGCSCGNSQMTSSQSGLSNVSLNRSSIGSFKSLTDDITLPRSRTISPVSEPAEPVVKLFMAPEIVLNQVEFSDKENDGESINRTINSSTTDSLDSNIRPRNHKTSNSPRLSHSPVEFKSSMAPHGSRIEDGNDVVSTEHFEKHIESIRANQLESQKRLFKIWINHYCPNLIQGDLIDELRDGIKLIGLLSYLANDKKLLRQYERLMNDSQSFIYKIATSHASIHRHLANVSTVVDYLREKRGMKLVNLNLMDIVSGKPNVILGLCWSIILNFQLDIDIARGTSASDNESVRIASRCSSRISLSSNLSDESSSSNHRRERIRSSFGDEYTAHDLLLARKNLLNQINKRFDLKLTNLTSSLLDCDVLISILRQLIPNDQERLAMDKEIELSSWHSLDDDAKLDLCFDIAQSRLRIPRLFSAADLRRQTLSDDRSKPILVYLSMLTKGNSSIEPIADTSSNFMIESKQEPQKLENEPSRSINEQVRNRLSMIDTKDRFELNRINSTLAQIETLRFIIADQANIGQIDQELINHFEKLETESKQIETLIAWINNSDRLFETPQRSPSDLAQLLDIYLDFFSPTNLPEIPEGLCQTLDRQYRECLNTAKHRILSMEQTLRNWRSFELSQNELKRWLTQAETKLTEALSPLDEVSEESGHSENLNKHLERLDEIVRFFELEEIDNDMIRDVNESSHSSVDRVCLSQSSISLTSNGSHASNVQDSKKAQHHKLIDEFELKCKLLAVTLDSQQKNALITASRQLKSRLKYITEKRVPQVVNELRTSIKNCEAWIIKEEDSINITNLDAANYNSEEDCNDDDKGVHDELDSGLPPDPCTSPEPSSSHQDVSVSSVSLSNRSKSRNRKTSGKKRWSRKRSVERSRTEGDQYDNSIRRKIAKVYRSIIGACRKTLPFNVILLLFVAGMFVVPMLQKDACCELSQSYISPSQLTFREKPT